MEIQIAVAKINRYATPDSGDTLEVVERPHGGLSVVLADAHSSGHEAKVISAMVVHKVIGLIAEGIKDSAAARAASEYLFSERNGKVTANLNILSIDLQTNTLVIARNNTVPVFMVARDRIDCLSAESVPIGNVRNIHPSICELPLESDLTVVVFTDGLLNAGQAYGKSLDFNTTLEALLIDQDNPQDLPSPQGIADALLSNAIRLDEGRPEDDMSVVVLRSLEQNRDDVRRMVINLPVNLRS